MSSILDSFTGEVPNGVSIEANIAEALEATKNMTAYEKAQWLRNKVGPDKEWDYKNTISKEYENFGNFHYGVIAKALFDKDMVLAGAGGAQFSSDIVKLLGDWSASSSWLYAGTAVSLFINLDNANDIPFIEAGIQAANKYLGLTNNDGVGFSDLVGDVILQKVEDLGTTIGNDVVNNILKIESNVYDLYYNNYLSNQNYSIISQNLTNYLVNTTSVYTPLVNNYFTPINIGAFYESSTSQIDNSESIAKKTYRILNSSNQTITKNQLNALDVNKDGKLSGNEISTLKTWKDLNEDGIAQAGEITTLDTTIYAKDYDTFTKGNGKFLSPTTPTPPTKQSVAYTTPSTNYASQIKTITTPAIPNSNFASLRANDNVYVINSLQRINWASNQVKINNNNKSYLIGTNGNDSFDYRYYAQYTKYFNINLLRNFLGGGGNDRVGGSNYADNIWGGTGNDTLYGYDGDDYLYGEEGDDLIVGEAGKVSFIKSTTHSRFYKANLKKVA